MTWNRSKVAAAAGAVAIVLSGCERTEVSRPAGTSTARGDASAAWAARAHPRLMMDAAQIRAWQKTLSPHRREMWQTVVDGIPSLKLARAPSRGRVDRGVGNMLARLAVTARLSGDAELTAVARQYLLDIARHGKPREEGDLERGHLLWGGAIAYDWLYGDMSEKERAEARAMLAREAQIHYEQTTTGRGYWRNQYLQNHGHVSLCGLAFTAAALHGEDPRAPRWLRLSDDFFAEVFRWSNPDGTSVEGLSYGAYALEFCLRYAELARQIGGVDYSRNPWLANMPLFILHSTLPVMNRREWAMDFGDSSRAANSHLPTHSLARIAATLRDPLAQGAGAMLRDLHGRLGNDPWQTVLWYDEKVPAAERSALPTFHHFADTGQVMMRTAWSEDAMLVGLHCGPWLGHNAAGRAKFDLGAAHAHPDANSFQIFAYGAWLLIDPGYTCPKHTADHSTLLIDGAGQLGEGVTWIAAEDATRHDHFAKILRAETAAQYDYVMGDATRTYHPGLGLKRYVRHWLFLKPTRTLVIVDDLAAAPTGYYKAWRRQDVQFADMKVEDPRQEFLVADRPDRRGKVWFTHDGPRGTFDIDVDYFDNSPGRGHYVLAVGDRVVAEWDHDVQDTDLHVRTVTGVAIAPGQKVELRGEPFGAPAKFIKMVVFSPTHPRSQPHQFQLLLHAPASAKVTPAGPGATPGAAEGKAAPATAAYTVDAGQALLDVRASAAHPDSSSAPQLASSAGPYQVARGSWARQTQRIVLSPNLSADKDLYAAVVVTVLQPRKPDDKPLGHIQARPDPADRSIAVRIIGHDGVWDTKVSLAAGQVRVVRQSLPDR